MCEVYKFILLICCFSSCAEKNSWKNTSRFPPESSLCLNIEGYISQYHDSIHRINLIDTNFYSTILYGEPANLISLKENLMSDGNWIYYKDSFNSWPIIFSQVKNHRRHGLFVYADSSNRYYKLETFVNGVKHGKSYAYRAPCQLQYLSTYRQGVETDTMFAFGNDQEISFIRLFDENGLLKEQINYWKWPAIMRSRKSIYPDSIVRFEELKFDSTGILLQRRTIQQLRGQEIEIRNRYNGNGSKHSTDTIKL